MLKLRRNLRKRQLKFPDRTSGSDGTRRCISSYIRTAIYFDQSLGFWGPEIFRTRYFSISANPLQQKPNDGERRGGKGGGSLKCV